MESLAYNIITSNGNYRVVNGQAVGKFFATRRTKSGWELTHLPSGFLVTHTRFSTAADAGVIAWMLETIYGDCLGEQAHDVLREHANKHPDLYNLIQSINAFGKTGRVLTSFDLSALAQKHNIQVN